MNGYESVILPLDGDDVFPRFAAECRCLDPTTRHGRHPDTDLNTQIFQACNKQKSHWAKDYSSLGCCHIHSIKFTSNAASMSCPFVRGTPHTALQ